mmetsp:Transcript_27027/g.30143  ORF Transcript_27027/g.30143 Transcript_27027/m.30143 type:complete len:294 (+) Transcript_27027:28-909(+)
MGICKKCNKKRTQFFDYQQEMYICEDCMYEGNERHFIRTYTEWINDAEHNGLECGICNEQIKDTEDFIRLTCMDTFHTSCLDKYGSAKPPTTALAGFGCPICNVPIAPSEKKMTQNTKMVQDIITKLRKMSWMRDLLPQQNKPETTSSPIVPRIMKTPEQAIKAAMPTVPKIPEKKRSPRVHPMANPSVMASRTRGFKPEENLLTGSVDDDDNKYKRRNLVSLLELIGIAERKPGAPRSEPPKINSFRMFLLILFVVVLGIVLVGMFFGPDLPELPNGLRTQTTEEDADIVQY